MRCTFIDQNAHSTVAYPYKYWEVGRRRKNIRIYQMHSAKPVADETIFFFCKFIFNSLFLFSKSIEMRAKSVQNNNNKRVFIANSNQYFRYCRSSLSLSPFASQINQLNIMSKGKTQKYRKHALASKSRSERFLNWRMKKLAWLKMKTRRSESWID